MGAQKYKPHYEHLKNKWTDRHNNLQQGLWDKHGESLRWAANQVKKAIAVGSLSGLLLLKASPSLSISVPSGLIPQQSFAKVADIKKSVFLISDLSSFVPTDVRPLSHDEERKITDILTRDMGFNVTAELDGKRLNRNYGFIGWEQHLARFPEDTIDSHFETEEERRTLYSSGMAPGLGAWGYFAPSRQQLTQQDTLREKYYIAVQTFLSADFMNKFVEYRDFYKYRKMLVVNPHNGKAVVADIADAGPSEWTGKHLGGSPEVMNFLEREDGSRKGSVLYFFVDDPDDKIPLGPVNTK